MVAWATREGQGEEQMKGEPAPLGFGLQLWAMWIRRRAIALNHVPIVLIVLPDLSIPNQWRGLGVMPRLSPPTLPFALEKF